MPRHCHTSQCQLLWLVQGPPRRGFAMRRAQPHMSRTKVLQRSARPASPGYHWMRRRRFRTWISQLTCPLRSLLFVLPFRSVSVMRLRHGHHSGHRQVAIQPPQAFQRQPPLGVAVPLVQGSSKVSQTLRPSAASHATLATGQLPCLGPPLAGQRRRRWPAGRGLQLCRLFRSRQCPRIQIR